MLHLLTKAGGCRKGPSDGKQYHSGVRIAQLQNLGTYLVIIQLRIAIPRYAVRIQNALSHIYVAERTSRHSEG